MEIASSGMSRPAALWLGMLAALVCQVFPATANEPSHLKVLFVGNSHLFVNNVPLRVQRRLKALDRSINYLTIAYGGARLIQHADAPQVSELLREADWDVIVLQEASASFISPRGRQRFHQSIDWFVRHAPPMARIVLYQTWPWRAGSRYLRQRGASSTEMWRIMQLEYAAVSRRHPRITIAPVGRCWMSSFNVAALYSKDGNHATTTGSQLAAAVIADTIRKRAPGRCRPS